MAINIPIPGYYQFTSMTIHINKWSPGRKITLKGFFLFINVYIFDPSYNIELCLHLMRKRKMWKVANNKNRVSNRDILIFATSATM